MPHPLTFALALWAGLQLAANGPARAGAPPISVRFDQGLVTIHASKVSAAEILKQYGVVGHVEIVRLDVLRPDAVTIVLDGVPEATALDILTRTCGGYLAVGRIDPVEVTQSHFRRLVLFPENKATPGSLPPVAPAPPPVESIEPAPGEVRPRLGPDGKPIEDDQQGAPPPPERSLTHHKARLTPRHERPPDL